MPPCTKLGRPLVGEPEGRLARRRRRRPARTTSGGASGLPAPVTGLKTRRPVARSSSGRQLRDRTAGDREPLGRPAAPAPRPRATSPAADRRGHRGLDQLAQRGPRGRRRPRAARRRGWSPRRSSSPRIVTGPLRPVLAPPPSTSAARTPRAGARQPDGDDGALARGGVQADGAAVGRDERGDDRQPEAGAAGGCGCARRRPGRSARTPARRRPGPCPGPRRRPASTSDVRVVRRLGHGHRDPRAGRGVRQRVGDQVADDLAQPALVAADDGDVGERLVQVQRRSAGRAGRPSRRGRRRRRSRRGRPARR